jgi:hypothetical protein
MEREPMIQFGNPLKFDPTRVFFSLPLRQAREASARVTAAVVTPSSRKGGLLDDEESEVLRASLARELPRLSTNDSFTLVAEVNATAHMIAAAEWRNAGHRPGDTPEISVSVLMAAVLIHLHASAESVPAQIRAATWTEHNELFKHHPEASTPDSKDEWRKWGQLTVDHQEAMHQFWDELRAKP